MVPVSPEIRDLKSETETLAMPMFALYLQLLHYNEEIIPMICFIYHIYHGTFNQINYHSDLGGQNTGKCLQEGQR